MEMNLNGKMAKIRYRRYFQEQRTWVFLGKILCYDRGCFLVEGKGVIVHTAAVDRVVIDEEPRILIIPRDNIAHIRLLPDDFSVEKIEVVEKGMRLFARVPGGPDTSIGETL